MTRKRGAWYNEKNPFCAKWLRNLIAAGLLPAGDVDERSIEDVEPQELARYVQCHFFAGIGVWPYALRLAGWSDNREVWTGSCPCQPFSQNGKREGFADERHLWPSWNHFITVRRPKCVYGEQIASEDGLAWLDLVQADLEAQDYTFGAVDLCSAGFGAPHVRQRLHFMADSDSKGLQRRLRVLERRAEGHLGPRGLADELDARRAGVVEKRRGGSTQRPGPTNGYWSKADWLGCQDGRWRAVEGGTFPLANGAANRVGEISAYGNALNAIVTSEFIRTTMEL